MNQITSIAAELGVHQTSILLTQGDAAGLEKLVGRDTSMPWYSRRFTDNWFVDPEVSVFGPDEL